MTKENTISKNHIIGVWNLLEFQIISNDGDVRHWAQYSHGILIYTDNNFVSVSINGKRNEEDVFLFYSGKYSIEKYNIINHIVINATDLNRINKSMIRAADYSNGILTITSDGNYGSARLRWEKI